MTEIDSQKLQTVLSEIDDQNNRNIQNDVPKAYRKRRSYSTNRVVDSEKREDMEQERCSSKESFLNNIPKDKM